MKNSISVTQLEESNWLYKADHHCLSARLLYLHNLIFSAEENASLAIELLLKCACKKKTVDFYGSKHDVTKLWKLANPPYDLDDGYKKYLEHLKTAANSRHPDSWETGRKGSDSYDMLDFLYLKLRKWVVSNLFSESEKAPTEFDLAKSRQDLFTNASDRHGAWSLSTILKRSNQRYDLL